MILLIITIIGCCSAGVALLHYMYTKGYFFISLLFDGASLLVSDFAGMYMWADSHCVDHIEQVSSRAILYR